MARGHQEGPCRPGQGGPSVCVLGRARLLAGVGEGTLVFTAVA